MSDRVYCLNLALVLAIQGLIVCTGSAQVPDTETEDALSALEKLCDIQQANLKEIGGFELKMRETVRIEKKEDTSTSRQYELAITHHEFTSLNPARSNVHRERVTTIKEGAKVISTQAAEYFCHLNSNFAFTYTTSQSLAYAYLASPNGAFSENCERRSRSFNPRNPLVYGFGDGDVLLADILAGARSSEPEFTVELDPEIVNGEVYKFKITNKLMGLNQEIVVSALRGGVVLESRIYDGDHKLVREKITEADSFRNAANELWFPIRWVETSYENHAGSPLTIAVQSENLVEHFTPSAIGNNESLELVGLFDGAIPVVLEQPDGKVLTTHLSNGVFDDVRLNEQLAITEKTTKETGS